MSLSLPAGPPRARSLTGVVPQMIAALEGRIPHDAVVRLCDRVAEPDDHAHA